MENRVPPDSLVALPEPFHPLPRFLEPDATPDQLVRAVVANHIDWFGQDFRYENGVRWKEGLIAFPKMPSRVASEQIASMVDYHRHRPAHQVACWSRTPTRPRDLGARLVAQGFDWGWRPHWMALDLRHIRADFPVPNGLHIAVDDVADWDVDDLPYFTRQSVENTHIEQTRANKRREWRFGAWLDGEIVGQSVLHLTTGRLGVAGIYNVGVVPAARRQGIGGAVSLAACQFARALGCHYAVLNAATHIYDRLGFVSLGWGQTWFLEPETLAAAPPTPSQVAYFEAVGRGSIRALNRLHQQARLDDLDGSLASGMTLMGLAVCMGKTSSAEWLIANGATLDIIHAWDLDWKERAYKLVEDFPDLVNRRVGRQGLTPLHEAAARNDIELARLVLTAAPDLTIRDRQYNGTPLDWAEVHGHLEISQLIKQQKTYANE